MSYIVKKNKEEIFLHVRHDLMTHSIPTGSLGAMC